MSLVPDPSPEPGGPQRWYLVADGELLVADEGGYPSAPGALEAVMEAPIAVGSHDGVTCTAAGVPTGTGAPPGHRWVPLMALGRVYGDAGWAVAGRAVQLVEWQRTSRYCGRCATPTAAVPGERARRCPSCGLLAYPRIAPAVIVLISRGDRILLARNASFAGRMFSTLAGFAEPGETLEDAVRREVAEEVGVELGAIRYFGSQPWPFPHSLMVGFTAEWAKGEIAVDGVEIAEAGWFGAEDLPEVPPRRSIARSMIDAWLAGA